MITLLARLIFVVFLFQSAASYAVVKEGQPCIKPENRTHQCKIEYVSIYRLIANGKDFDNKLVNVSGYLKIVDREVSLYVSENDAKHGLYMNSLHASFDGIHLSDLQKYNGKFVFLEGTFINGWTDSSSGTVDKVYLLSSLRK
ncbi:hypothetical protein [Pleionea sediminis]|uniref:hypothetical protein n=1 Tax=Pleionea sediminis TaxID=2569479 RepID=UPI00118646BA|nr:hypothetical protein [Pleionea sediminis]